MNEQENNLQRVRSRIAASILQFVRSRTQFFADELRKHVEDTVGITAPASADRILRDLRQKGFINYRVIDRRRSHYQVEAK